MLESIRLENFKSFRDVEVNFGPFSVIIGSNGAGKSNLFDALRFLRAIGDGRSVRDAIEGHALPGSSSIQNAGIRGGSAAATHFLSDDDTFQLSVRVRLDDEVIAYSVGVDVSRHRIVREQLSSSRHGEEYVYSTNPNIGPLSNQTESPVIKARFYKRQRGVNPKRDFSPHEFILTQFISRQAESRDNERVRNLLVRELSSLSPLELDPSALRQYSPRGYSEMGEHGEYFAGAVASLEAQAGKSHQEALDVFDSGDVDLYVSAQERLDAMLAWMSEMTPREITELTTRSSPTGEVVIALQEEPYSEYTLAPSLSDGTLRFAALALVTIGSEGRRSLLIEELENGINPARVSLLVRMFDQAVRHGDALQVIASTHSPTVLQYAAEFALDGCIVIGWNDESSSSRAVRISELPMIESILDGSSLGELQEEGWFQAAAGV